MRLRCRWSRCSRHHAISSGQNTNLYRGDSPTHVVAYATSANCASGISAIQIYTADGVLAYSSLSSYVDVQLPLSPNYYELVIKAWDNCGGVASDVIQDYVQSSSGQVTVNEPIASFAYAPQIAGTSDSNILVNALATTTCPNGVSAMGVYDAPHHKVAGQNGATLSAPITLQPGTTNLVVEEWDNCGGAATTTVPVTVADNGFPITSEYAYIPDVSTGTLQGFYSAWNSCALNPVPGNPAPAHYHPISVGWSVPYFFVLNQDTKDISIYYQDMYVAGSLTQVPGSPFSLNEPDGYTPTGMVVVADENPIGIFVSNIKTSGSGAGSIGEYSFSGNGFISGNQFSELSGSPLILKGDAQPTGIYLGPYSGSEVGGVLLTANGSSISVLKSSNTIANDGPLAEVAGSPFPAPGRYSASAGVQDLTVVNTTDNNGFVYTANAEGTISGFAFNNDFQLAQVAGSPFVDPDHTNGSAGNPTSLAYNGSRSVNDLYVLNAGAEDIGLFSVNQSTGVLTHVSDEQKGRIKASPQVRIRFSVTGNVNCLATSNGYAMSVNLTTGVTTLEPGSPFLGPGVYPDIALSLY